MFSKQLKKSIRSFQKPEEKIKGDKNISLLEAIKNKDHYEIKSLESRAANGEVIRLI